MTPPSGPRPTPPSGPQGPQAFAPTAPFSFPAHAPPQPSQPQPLPALQPLPPPPTAQTPPGSQPPFAAQSQPYPAQPPQNLPVLQPMPPMPSAPHGVPQPLPPNAPLLPPAGSPIASHHQPAFVQQPGANATRPEFGAIGHQPPQHIADPGDSIDEIPGSQFVKFLKISSKRAFRLRIEPREVLPAERASLEAATPPIRDLNLQAFLAWRRSVLFLVAVALVPLTIIGLVDALAGSMPTAIRFVKLAPAVAEGLFCWICWTQLKRWSHWRTQRTKLFWGWLLFMTVPFIVFLYPLSSAVADSFKDSVATARALGIAGIETSVRNARNNAFMPFVYAMIAMLQLAPKAISLMPGLIRSSLVIKLLFPGSTAPGWLIVMCAPLYALLAYVILIIPYQVTGSGWFIFGVLGLIVGQGLLARSGFALAKPLTEEEALKHINRVRAYYLVVMFISAVLIIIALGSLVGHFNMRVTDVITAIMKFETNVLILTMIGADLVVTNLDRARSSTIGKGHVEEQAEVKIAAFVSLDAPATPPPSNPAQ